MRMMGLFTSSIRLEDTSYYVNALNIYQTRLLKFNVCYVAIHQVVFSVYGLKRSQTPHNFFVFLNCLITQKTSESCIKLNKIIKKIQIMH